MSFSVRRLAVAAAVVLTAGALPVVALSAAEAAPADEAFRPTSGFKPTGDKVRVQPDSYSAVEVDLANVRSTLRAAPREGVARGTLTFQVPAPDGGTERFAVQRTQVMEPGLAAAHPEITTYSGVSLDHPATTVALDVTPMGFHASVRGPNGQGAWYVDPAYNKQGTTTHLSYYGGSVPEAIQDFVERDAPELRKAVQARKSGRSTAPGDVVTQKVYRLALTSDPSYADYFGTDFVTAEKATLINRVNQIYNDDLAIKLVLVDDTDLLNLDTNQKAMGADGPCGAHPCFDPGDGLGGPSQLDYCDVPGLDRNRVVLGQLVGADNYDIGHLALGVNGGGIAFLGVVGADFKGGGCTGLPQPQGDFFAIDYVAHEMGHQFAGNHTFNGVQNACYGGNREASTSVEPGSGSSVMAYAGICKQDDLQPHTDPYFSQRTVDEVTNFTQAEIETVIEVQTLSLRDFDTNGDYVELSYPGGDPVRLTRGGNYTNAGIETALEALTGENVTVAPWGYDPFGSWDDYPAPIEDIDDTGFQVIFAATADVYEPGLHVNKPDLTISETNGTSGFIGETAKGGAADNGGSATVVTANHNPVVTAPESRTLPVQTPFTLTGSGVDPDEDDLIYLWEQNDIGKRDGDNREGGTSLVDNKKKTGPLFRVFGKRAVVTDEGTLESPSPGENMATGNPSRTFPDIKQVINGNTNAESGRCPKAPGLPNNPNNAKPLKSKLVNCYSEFLPTPVYNGTPGAYGNPAMHFRLTARDGVAEGGGLSYDDVTLRIDSDRGPFLVTSQKKKHTYKAGKKVRIAWDVNRTKKLAAQVRILLTTDKGKTWEVLKEHTPNDGAKKVRLPQVKTKKARFMVAAVDNYFFDVSNHNVRIK